MPRRIEDVLKRIIKNPGDYMTKVKGGDGGERGSKRCMEKAEGSADHHREGIMFITYI